MDYIPELNDKQLDRLSEFLANIALLIIASLIFPNIFGTSSSNIIELLGGIILTLLLMFISMVIVKGK